MSELDHMAAVDIALRYAAMGVPVFPCRATDKAPMTPHGFHDATTNLDRIRAWWATEPDALIGAPTSAASGVYIVDLDIDKETGEAIGEASADRLGLTEALRKGMKARSPSGGWHYYFAHPGDTYGRHTKVKPGLDLLGTGGYAILCGSAGYEPVGPALYEVGVDALLQVPDAILQVARSAVGGRKQLADRPSKPLLEFNAAGPQERERLLSLIRSAPNTLSREGWVKLCFAVKSAYGDEGREAFLDFSGRYVGPITSGEAERVWDTAQPDGQVGLGSVRYLLDQSGAGFKAAAPEETGHLLDKLAERVESDPGAPFAPDAVAALAMLRASDQAAFETLRAELKSAGCRVGELDKAIGQASETDPRTPKQADVLIVLGSEADLFHSPDGDAYADVIVNGHRETWRLRSAGFRQWLTRVYFEETDSAPNADALNAALGTLEARAHFDGPEREVFVRIGGINARIYVDLCDPEWRAIEIDQHGWRVIDTPPVRFRRAKGMAPLPPPVSRGSINDLRQFLNVASDEDFVLTVAWMLGALRHHGPYPALVLTGEQGSAKSTFAQVLRRLVDPNTSPLRALARDERDLFISATNGHVLAFDNISGLSHHMSDTLCRLATGGGFAVRQLYSDQEEVLFEAARPMILNGIDDVVTRADLADRAIILALDPIPESRRQPEADLWAAFEKARPAILGALLDGVSEGLRQLPDMRLPSLPRMADFAVLAAACETAFWPEGTFWDAYAGNRSAAIDDVIDADPVAAAVRAIMKDQSLYEGTATDLLALLAQAAGERVAKSRTWPASASALSGRLKRASTFLRQAGITVEHLKSNDRARTRLVRLSRRSEQTPDKPRQTASAASGPSGTAGQANAHKASDGSALRTGTSSTDAAPSASGPSAVRAPSMESAIRDATDGMDDDLPDASADPKSRAWRARI